VVGGGAEHWRKGKDLFVQLAFLVRSRGHHNTHFLWLGEWDHPDRKLEIAHDLELLALSDQVHFIGQVDDPTDYFAAADFFVMVSREDPFPLVCLEAAFVSKPIICFSHAGGMPEFVADDCGFVVPYLDLNSMADKIELLIENPALAEKLGSNARTKVLQNHSLERIAPEILDCMRQTARTRADRIE
jgi:glycosyltransferase involved in cell wall biosynthesis